MATVCSTSGCGTGGWTGPLPGDPDNSSVLTASSEYGGIQLVWTLPNVNAFAVAHTKVFRNTVDNIETAPLLVVISGNQFFDRNSADTIQEYFYWIQHISVNGTTLFPIGPITATPRAQIEQVIAALTNRIEDSALSTSLRESIEQIPVLENGLTLTNQTLVTETGLTAQELVALRDDLTDAVAYINTQTQLQLDQQGTFVSSLNTQLAQFGDTLYAAVEEETETRALETGELFAQKTVRFDLAGNISGYGMSASVDPDGTSVSDFQIRADTFSMAPPITNQATPPDTPFHGMIWGDTSETPMVVKWYDDVLQAWGTTPIQGTVPFIVKTTPEMVDGYMVEPGVYIDSAVISRLQARQIDARGLTIRNDEGNVLLEAGGDSTPPWVVRVDNSADPGSVLLAAPPDEANRARIRSLLVDNVGLRARITPSGNSVEVTATASEVWRMMYATPITMVPVDGTRELDYASFDVEAGRVYSVELRVVGKAVSSDTSVELYFQSPAGTTGTLPNGVTFIGGSLVNMSTTAMTTVGTTYINPTVLRLLVIVGETAGKVTFHAKALGGIRFERGTEFRADRIVNYKSPLLVVAPLATYHAPMTGDHFRSVRLVDAVDQPYNATFTMTCQLRSVKTTGNPWFTGPAFRISGNRIEMNMAAQDLGWWRDLQTRFDTYDFITTETSSSGATQNRYTLVSMCDILTGYTDAEKDRWEFQVRRRVVSLGAGVEEYFDQRQPDYIDTYRPGDLSVASPGSATFVQPTSLSGSVSGYEQLAFNGSPSDVPTQGILEYTVTTLFMGAPIADPWIVRVIFNYW